MILFLSLCLVIDPPDIRIQDDMQPSLHKVVWAQAATFEFAMTNSVTGVIPPPPLMTHAWLGWPRDPSPNYFCSEMWHSTNCLNWDIYEYCSYTNFMIVPMNRVWTNYPPQYDTNGVFLGLLTNRQNSDFFMEVEVELWNKRITNILVIQPLP